MRNIQLIKILALAFIMIGVTSCFKEEKQGTQFKIAVTIQNVETDPLLPCPHELDSYAFYVPKGSKWEVSTWEDALARRITNVNNPAEQLTNPEVKGTCDINARHQLTLELWSQYVFMVVVDPVNRIYATRFYETPMNWPVTETELHMYAWRKSGTATGWDVVNPFPDEQREPLVPAEDEEHTEDVTE